MTIMTMTIHDNGVQLNIIKIEQTMTSLEIAELTGKQHKNLMRDIRNMEPAWEKVHGLKFELIEYKDRLGCIKPCYSLTKTETLYIATKFNDEVRAKQFSIALKGAGVTRNSVQQMLKNWRIQGLVEQMDDGRYKKVSHQSSVISH